MPYIRKNKLSLHPNELLNMNHFRNIIITVFVSLFCTALFAQQNITPKTSIEKSPSAKSNYLNKNKSVYFNLLFNDSLHGISEAGVETDGSYIYTAVWSDDSLLQRTIYRYSMTGIYVDSFKIDSVVGLRDLAYDGTYFYGGTDDHYIYGMNFTTHTVIDTIVCPIGVTVRSIAYDPVYDGFWVGGWDTDLWLISRTGLVIDTISYTDHGLIGMYGSAYDSISPGGPYLWIFDQNTSANQNDLVQIKISTGKQTGLIHDVTSDMTVNPGSVAGGLFTYYHADTTILGGLVQGSKVFGYDLSSMIIPSDVGVVKILSPVSSCNLTSHDTVKVIVKNYGFNPATGFNIKYKYKLVIDTETFSASIPPFSTDTFTFANTLDLSVVGLQDTLYAYTTLVGDAFTTNDTAQKLITHVAPVIPFYAMGFETAMEFEGWKIIDLNKDGYTWSVKNELPYEGNYSAVYSFNPYGNANDWLFTKCLNLSHDTTYVLSFYYRVRSKNYSEQLKVKIGMNQDTLDLDSTIVNLGSVIDTVYKLSAKQFKVPVTGTYYIGWNCYSLANMWNLYIDDIRLTPGILGVSEIRTDAMLNVFPNPANDQISFYCSENMKEIKIMNVLGEEILTKNPSAQNTTLDVSSLGAGMYFAMITTAKGTVVRKIQIAR